MQLRRVHRRDSGLNMFRTAHGTQCFAFGKKSNAFPFFSHHGLISSAHNSTLWSIIIFSVPRLAWISSEDSSKHFSSRRLSTVVLLCCSVYEVLLCFVWTISHMSKASSDWWQYSVASSKRGRRKIDRLSTTVGTDLWEDVNYTINSRFLFC